MLVLPECWCIGDVIDYTAKESRGERVFDLCENVSVLFFSLCS